MKIGLIGLPLVGKTIVFNLLTGRAEATAAFAGGKAETHLARIKVPDPRLDRLTEIFIPRKTTPAEIEFVDLVGQAVGGGAGLSSDVLGELRNLDALVHVLRDFDSEQVPRDGASQGPLADAEVMEQELILTDLILVEKRLEKLRKDAMKGVRDASAELALIEKLAGILENEKPLRSAEFTPEESRLLHSYQFVSLHPIIILLNQGDDSAAEFGEMEAWCRERKLAFIAMNALTEWEIVQLPEEERGEFLDDLGITEPGRDRFIRTCYALLDLVSFFTVGEDEVRAWTIRRNLPAVRAAGKIHSDLERGFIRAETVAYDVFQEIGSLADARKQGVLRLEGKEYPVQDGDIITIRFNV